MNAQELSKILVGAWKSDAENIYIEFRFNGMALLGFESMPYTLSESNNNIEINLPHLSSVWTVDTVNKDRIVVQSQESGKLGSKLIELTRV